MSGFRTTSDTQLTTKVYGKTQDKLFPKRGLKEMLHCARSTIHGWSLKAKVGGELLVEPCFYYWEPRVLDTYPLHECVVKVAFGKEVREITPSLLPAVTHVNKVCCLVVLQFPDMFSHMIPVLKVLQEFHYPIGFYAEVRAEIDAFCNAASAETQATDSAATEEEHSEEDIQLAEFLGNQLTSASRNESGYYVDFSKFFHLPAELPRWGSDPWPEEIVHDDLPELLQVEKVDSDSDNEAPPSPPPRLEPLMKKVDVDATKIGLKISKIAASSMSQGISPANPTSSVDSSGVAGLVSQAQEVSRAFNEKHFPGKLKVSGASSSAVMPNSSALVIPSVDSITGDSPLSLF
jgi:hypothetical protein